jgi:D-alanyl-D-alanine carboxypeptidase
MPGTPSSNAMRWGIYLLIGLSLAGLALRVTTRTTALAREAAAPTDPPAPTVVVLTQAPAPTAATTAVSLAPTPSVVASPTSLPTQTPQPTETQAVVTAVGECAAYPQVPAELLTVVNRDVALARDFVPADLEEVPLAEKNLAFRPIPLRLLIHQPLLDMLDAMNQAGLRVWVMSGFRSYSEQTLAYEKWLKLYPDRASDISAIPGHSEHQLGTAVDFSTPYMDDLYGDLFHVNFSKTPEGEWLAKQAAYYGFTLSYPQGATEQTGYAWEPWHYRYVGILAQALQDRQETLTEYLAQCGGAAAQLP